MVRIRKSCIVLTFLYLPPCHHHILRDICSGDKLGVLSGAGQRAPSLGVGVHHVEARAEVGEGRPRPGRRTGIGKLSREPEAPETPTSEPAGPRCAESQAGQLPDPASSSGSLGAVGQSCLPGPGCVSTGPRLSESKWGRDPHSSPRGEKLRLPAPRLSQLRDRDEVRKLLICEEN